ncbi:MAG TPA: hypothetical protein VHQ90_14000 [Thermoanaerobaculia bacterium]|nr:hypothetical protein [Thermoanaerobaculia bacterium]
MARRASATAIDPREAERMAKRRNTLTSIFMAMLISIAFREMVGSVRISVRAHGLTFSNLTFCALFFLTSLRFFVGNLFHLMSPDLVTAPGRVWLYDFFVIVIQSTLLIFLGGVSSLDETRASPIGFFWLLIWLYLLDVLWIGSQWLLARFSSSCRRSHYPWRWFILNLTLIGLMLSLFRASRGDVYSQISLAILLVLTASAFIVDIVMTDEYHVV